MPIYEYECNACGETYSLLQRVGSDKGSACPKCDSDNVRKKVSAFSCSSPWEGSSSSFPSSGFSGGG